LYKLYQNYSCFKKILILNIILQIAQLLFKGKSRTGSKSRSGSVFGSAYFVLEAPEVEAPRVEAVAKAEALKILALPHHCE
jgi:hypothetical protein